mgnify:CR=1 FL=1
MKLRVLNIIFVVVVLVCDACQTDKATQEGDSNKQTTRQTYYSRNLSAMARITTYDIYGAKIDGGNAVYIAPDIVVTPMSWVKGALKAKLNAMDSNQAFNIFGYTAYDIDNDLVALRVERRLQNDKIPPIDTLPLSCNDTLYSLDYKSKKMLKTTLSINEDMTISTALTIGTALFDKDGNLRGVAGENNHLIPSRYISNISQRISDSHENIYELRLKTNKKYPSASSIRGVLIETTMGNITMRLFDETPEYRDNIIHLIYDHFYDSLLIHRVLPNYLIQTGAADSKHAKNDDPVGWQGPGYTLPMHIVPGLFHKRGMVASSKLPQDRNKNNRSDGSQFYIVSGRVFTEQELNDIEKVYGKHFTVAQRRAYTTIGGAPYLDGDYTIFAEITSGMDVVDKIASQPVKADDRPINDIRVKQITLLKK